MAKLRPGLLDPLEVVPTDLPDYMADSYRGYMVEIRERLSIFDDYRSVRFRFKEIDREFFALQLRMIFELIAYSVITFQQIEVPIAKKKRKNNHAIEVMNTVLKTDWIRPVDSKFQFILNSNEQTLPDGHSFFSEKENFKSVHGKFGGILHAQQRPRNDNSGKLTLAEIFDHEIQLRALLDQHLITDDSGQGWYVNINFPNQPRNVLMVKIDTL